MSNQKPSESASERLFADDQKDLFEKSYEERVQDEKNKPVECLGMTFPNDEERRNYFLEKLREKLKDPEFRKIEGFPIGLDEDILALSDPPYYAACPNPFVEDFIKHYGKPYDAETDEYCREPFAADVSEGKNDPIYNAHSYHTKVPHKAIMRYILHYTEPGDVVFDGFCGTGMTGVAAQMCADRNVVSSLGYKVKPDGTSLWEEKAENGKKTQEAFSSLGARRAVLNDLSPAATFIAYNYNASVDVQVFEQEVKRILGEVEKECGWMYETKHSDGRKGKINYTVWSEVYSCPQCSGEVIYYEAAFRENAGKVEYLKEFECYYCRALCAKSPSKNSSSNKLERVRVSEIDKYIGSIHRIQRRIPVLINYSVGTSRYEKRLDANDLAIIEEIGKYPSFDDVAIDRMPQGDESRRNDDEGITHVHHFYADRVLSVLSEFIRLAKTRPQLNFLLGSVLPKLTIMNRYMPQHGGRALVGPMANTLYVPPVCVENNVIDQLWFQSKKIVKALNSLEGNLISTQAAQQISMPNNSVDYIFVDPPFGANIMYSELSYIREAWMKIFTNSALEAIENKTQRKTTEGYRLLMTGCFKEAYRIIKPGRWITVEFSNTKASIWNSIQNALSEAGFIVASVTTLDKTRGGLHAMIGPTAVKQDLVISAYKPNGGFEQRFLSEAATEEGIWDFIRTHLEYLPTSKRQGVLLQMIPERDPRILFDQMVAYYVRKGYQIPISSHEFQMGLAQQFPSRDGMYFLPDQVAEYDKIRMMTQEVLQPQLFVFDEATAIQWLKQQLTKKPQTFQELHPRFLKEIGGWQKHEKPLELSEMLEQNFLRYDARSEVPSQIHSYLSTNFRELRNLPKVDEDLRRKAKDRWYMPDPNKAGDIEKLRERALLREFEDYRDSKQQRLKVFRFEAVRSGFKREWQDRNYTTIIDVARKIPEKVLQEDPKLLMWYHLALTRTGDEP